MEFFDLIMKAVWGIVLFFEPQAFNEFLGFAFLNKLLGKLAK